METLTLKLSGMAHGGSAVGRDKDGRPIFVPYAIPGERVRVRLTAQKQNFARAELLELLEASPERVEPPCPHFGVCGGCHLQHMSYASQLRAKQDVVRDQLQRIGGLKSVKVRPTLPHPTPWQYALEMSFSPSPDGRLGLWSPVLQQVMPVETCHIIHPDLLELLQDIDLELPDLRKLTLRRGDDGAMLAAFEVEGVEAPELEVDFPVSVALILPDNTAASLIGEHYLVRTVRERDFRVSPGCYFPASPAAAEQVVDTVLRYARLSGQEQVLEGYSGVGALTAFLAPQAATILCIEANPDAVADMAVNLDDMDNVAVYEGFVEEVLPALDIRPDVIVVHPPSDGLSTAALKALIAKTAARIIYVSSEVATLARDGKQLSRAGYRPVEVQPIDTAPQTYHIETVSLWERGKG
jgi:23S rRNA (uracil1939-C5)-methyltransferase